VQGGQAKPEQRVPVPNIQRRDRVEAAVATAAGRPLAGDVVAG